MTESTVFFYKLLEPFDFITCCYVPLTKTTNLRLLSFCTCHEKNCLHLYLSSVGQYSGSGCFKTLCQGCSWFENCQSQW